MENDSDNSKLSLKFVVGLSSFLIAMDFMEIYLSFVQLKAGMIKYDEVIYENCIQFNLISQIVFTFFAALAGVSAFILGTGLLYDSDYFAEKLSKSYLYFNYVVFGPYLFTATIYGMLNFNSVVYTCDHSMTNQYFNLSNLLSLIVCFLLSGAITLGYSFFYSIKFIFLSIRFKKGGFKPLGKFFWFYVTRQNREETDNQALEPNNQEMEIREANVEMMQSMEHTLTVEDISTISPPRFILNENLVENEEHAQEDKKSMNKSITSEASVYKNDKLCQMLQKIINNENTTEVARKRALNALNLRKKLLH